LVTDFSLDSRRAFTTYEQVVECLFGRINYERISGSEFSVADFKLDRMREFLRRLGDPHRAIPAVHIAGTKGKGSTAAFVASILRESGYRTGLFTSPHLRAFEERMTVDGRPPSQEELVGLVNRIMPVVEAMDALPAGWSPTYFEIATALGWLYLVDRGATVAVLEVGLGGRLDATNVCFPAVSVITTISRDHVQQLGPTLRHIAAEKAGILKRGVPCVTGDGKSEVLEVLERVRREVSPPEGAETPLRRVGVDFHFHWRPAEDDRTRPGDVRGDRVTISVPPRVDGPTTTPRRSSTEGVLLEDVELPLLGEHQGLNAAVAVAAIEELRRAGWSISEEAIQRGLRATRWPGRIEVLGRRPCVVIDAGHNWAAIAALLATVERQLPARRRILLFAATRDKDVAGLLRQLLPAFDTVIATAYRSNPRALPVPELVDMIRAQGAECHPAAGPDDAWQLARSMAGCEDLIVVTGSIFIAAEVRELVTAPPDESL
jgi:dihydrofolate synthase/folylpolyglutamate synthase